MSSPTSWGGICHPVESNNSVERRGVRCCGGRAAFPSTFGDVRLPCSWQRMRGNDFSQKSGACLAPVEFCKVLEKKVTTQLPNKRLLKRHKLQKVTGCARTLAVQYHSLIHTCSIFNSNINCTKKRTSFYARATWYSITRPLFTDTPVAIQLQIIIHGSGYDVDVAHLGANFPQG